MSHSHRIAAKIIMSVCIFSNCCVKCSGEKLIVTKKNEGGRSYYKCVGWLFTMILLGGAIAVAVLIGGNINLFMKSPRWNIFGLEF